MSFARNLLLLLAITTSLPVAVQPGGRAVGAGAGAPLQAPVQVVAGAPQHDPYLDIFGRRARLAAAQYRCGAPCCLLALPVTGEQEPDSWIAEWCLCMMEQKPEFHQDPQERYYGSCVCCVCGACVEKHACSFTCGDEIGLYDCQCGKDPACCPRGGIVCNICTRTAAH